MSKVKSSAIPHYEMLYIISNQFSENELEPINEKVKKFISDNGGTITFSESWGKKRLSYAIKGFYHGYYELVEFNLPGASLARVEKLIRMASDILRHQIVTKKVKSAAEIQKDKKIAEKIASKVAKEEDEIKEKAKEKAKSREKSKEKESDKIDLKDLDDKLDKILETGDLL